MNGVHSKNLSRWARRDEAEEFIPLWNDTSADPDPGYFPSPCKRQGKKELSASECAARRRIALTSSLSISGSACARLAFVCSPFPGRKGG